MSSHISILTIYVFECFFLDGSWFFVGLTVLLYPYDYLHYHSFRYCTFFASYYRYYNFLYGVHMHNIIL